MFGILEGKVISKGYVRNSIRISLSEERKTRIRKHIENDEKENIICQG
jgi:hypothetical protein